MIEFYQKMKIGLTLALLITASSNFPMNIKDKTDLLSKTASHEQANSSSQKSSNLTLGPDQILQEIGRFNACITERSISHHDLPPEWWYNVGQMKDYYRCSEYSPLISGYKISLPLPFHMPIYSRLDPKELGYRIPFYWRNPALYFVGNYYWFSRSIMAMLYYSDLKSKFFKLCYKQKRIFTPSGGTPEGLYA